MHWICVIVLVIISLCVELTESGGAQGCACLAKLCLGGQEEQQGRIMLHSTGTQLGHYLRHTHTGTTSRWMLYVVQWACCQVIVKCTMDHGVCVDEKRLRHTLLTCLFFRLSCSCGQAFKYEFWVNRNINWVWILSLPHVASFDLLCVA